MRDDFSVLILFGLEAVREFDYLTNVPYILSVWITYIILESYCCCSITSGWKLNVILAWKELDEARSFNFLGWLYLNRCSYAEWSIYAYAECSIDLYQSVTDQRSCVHSSGEVRPAVWLRDMAVADRYLQGISLFTHRCVRINGKIKWENFFLVSGCKNSTKFSTLPLECTWHQPTGYAPMCGQLLLEPFYYISIDGTRKVDRTGYHTQWASGNWKLLTK